MKSLLLFVFAICAAFQIAYSIKCYACSGAAADCTKQKLESNREKYLKDCSTDYFPTNDRCFKMSTKKGDVRGVTMTCGSKYVCETAQRTCDKLSSGDGSCVVGCCQTDACNAGTSVFISALLVAVCVFLGAVV